jgi:hypothetical protein
MRLCCLIILSLSIIPSVTAQSGYTEKEVIGYAQGLDIRKLDRKLPHVRLDQWLRFGAPHLDNVTWETNDCDINVRSASEIPANEWPLCVRFGFQRGGEVDGWGLIQVGTYGTGMDGYTHLRYILAGAPIEGYLTSDRLSDLPRLLNKASLFSDSEKEVIGYSKALSVLRLDPKLPSQRLDEWLYSIVHIKTVIWEPSPSCDLKEPELQNSPFCVRLTFRRGRVSGWALIKVGEFGKVSGPPHLEYFFTESFPTQKWSHVRQNSTKVSDIDTTKLSDLPRALDEASSQTNHCCP